MADAFDDLDAAGKEMEALEDGKLTPPPAGTPPPSVTPAPPVAAPLAEPPAQPAPPAVGPTPPAAPAEPYVFPATRAEYDAAMNPPAPAPAPPPTPDPTPPAAAEPLPGQAVPWARFEEVRRSAAEAKAQVDALLRLNMNPNQAGQPPAGAPQPTAKDPRIPKEYTPEVAALVAPVIQIELERERDRMWQEIRQEYEPVLAKQRQEAFIDSVDKALGTAPGTPGFRGVYPQVNDYYNSLPAQERTVFESVHGAIALMTIMQNRGLLKPTAAAPATQAAPPAAPRFVGPTPVLDPSTARAHMELRTGREPSQPMPLSPEQASHAINAMSPEAFAAYKERMRDGKSPLSGEPDSFLR